jgi:hypothetical protein
MSEGSVISRLAQVIYVIGCIASVVFAITSVFLTIGVLKLNEPVEIIFAFVAACASYGLGWSIRYVVTGETKSVIT